MRGAFFRLLVCVGLAMICACPVLAERRVALVVGNAAYQHATRLQNPGNDASDMKAKLESLGFDVTLARDQGSDAFFDAVQAFSTKLAGADLALFYYSGHGVQFEGTNYLVPVDTRIDGAFALKRRAISAQDIVEQMERGAKASLLFLDACRNNTLLRELEQSLPAQSRAGAANRGLARMDAKGSNTLIVFATAPNDVAADGTGSRNSPFTAALLKFIETPGVVVQEMLTDVTAEVERTTMGRQKPELLARLTSKIRLAAATPIPIPPIREREAAAAWDVIKDSCSPALLDTFQKRYGDTFFGDLAKQRIDGVCVEERARAKQRDEDRARQLAAAAALAESEARARAEAERKARAERDAKQQSDEAAAQARQEAEKKAKVEADAKAKAEREAQKANEEATAKARAEADAKAKIEAAESKKAGDKKAAASATTRSAAEASGGLAAMQGRWTGAFGGIIGWGSSAEQYPASITIVGNQITSYRFMAQDQPLASSTVTANGANLTMRAGNTIVFKVTAPGKMSAYYQRTNGQAANGSFQKR